MRPISRTFLARILAAQITDAACGDQGQWWSEQEAAHAAATRAAAAGEASAPALALCADCPARSACAELAELNRYTGLAAGTVYVNGERRSPSTVIRIADPETERRAG